MPTELNTFFYPKSIAVVGASRSPEKLGAIILKNIIESGFSGSVFPINPQAEELQGVKCYKSINDLPEKPELAIVSIPSNAAVEAVEALGSAGILNVVVLSAGFKELGAEGADLEKKLQAIIGKYKMNLLGPNCLGFINNTASLNATFAEKVKETGNLRFIAQSGAIAASLFDYCNTVGLGISEFITLGNKAGLNENDFLNYFIQQQQNTLVAHKDDGLSDMNPVGLYLESISEGSEFLKLIKQVSLRDPVIVLKPGKTQSAAKAMQSHTGSIAGEDSVLDSLLKQSGAIRVHTLEEFFDYTKAFSWENAPKGSKIAVISNAGGPAVISADAIEASGLELTQFDDSTKEKLNNVLPRSASIINPVDVLGDALADRFSEAIDIVLQNENVDSLLVLLTPQLMTQIEKTAQVIGELAKKYNKPVFCSFIGGHAVDEGKNILNHYKIPSFAFPERAIGAIASMWHFRNYQQTYDPAQEATVDTDISAETGTIRNIIQQAVTAGKKSLDNLDVDVVLKSAGIHSPITRRVQNIQEAKDFANETRWPVVLKLSSPGLIHKKDVGGVITNIVNEQMLESMWNNLEHKIEQLDEDIRKNVSIQVQKEILGGVEVIVGVKDDPIFGPIMLFGAGGDYAHLIEDANICTLPIDKNKARKLVESSKICKLLKGHEGALPCECDKLCDLMVRIGKLKTLIPEATDIEINPVISTLNDAWAVDGKILLKEGEKKPAARAPMLKEAVCTLHDNPSSKFNYYEFETAEPFTFKAGQYISVKVSPTAIRAYSIATKISENKFALLVDTRPGGPGSQFFENLKAGEKIPFLGPFGVFTLDVDDGSEQLLFLATGSGISAIRCMIDDALMLQNYKGQISLYFGLTHESEIFWKEHFDELAARFPNFKYDYVLFKPSEAWQGPKGFNTDMVVKNFADTCNCSVYLCGHPAMIASASELVAKMGCPQNRIYTERFA